MSDKLRVDKWMWTVRLVKTRSMATELCNKGKVSVNGQLVKPSRFLKAGDSVIIQNGSLFRTFSVIGFPLSRVGARDVQNYCTETTPAEELHKHEAMRKAAALWRQPGAGRPTKKERRELDDFIWGGQFDNFD